MGYRVVLFTWSWFLMFWYIASMWQITDSIEWCSKNSIVPTTNWPILTKLTWWCTKRCSNQRHCHGVDQDWDWCSFRVLPQVVHETWVYMIILQGTVAIGKNMNRCLDCLYQLHSKVVACCLLLCNFFLGGLLSSPLFQDPTRVTGGTPLPHPTLYPPHFVGLGDAPNSNRSGS